MSIVFLKMPFSVSELQRQIHKYDYYTGPGVGGISVKNVVRSLTRINIMANADTFTPSKLTYFGNIRCGL